MLSWQQMLQHRPLFIYFMLMSWKHVHFSCINTKQYINVACPSVCIQWIEMVLLTDSKKMIDCGLKCCVTGFQIGVIASHGVKIFL